MIPLTVSQCRCPSLSKQSSTSLLPAFLMSIVLLLFLLLFRLYQSHSFLLKFKEIYLASFHSLFKDLEGDDTFLHDLNQYTDNYCVSLTFLLYFQSYLDTTNKNLFYICSQELFSYTKKCIEKTQYIIQGNQYDDLEASDTLLLYFGTTFTQSPLYLIFKVHLLS